MSASAELTDELAEMLAAVAASPGGYTVEGSDESDPADNALTQYERNKAERLRTKQIAALSVLQQLGYVVAHTDGYWFIEPAGAEALASREEAIEAARRTELADSYVSLVGELRAVADALESLPLDGLVEVTVEMRIAMAHRRAETDEAKVATVDAIASAVLNKSAETSRVGSHNLWQHSAEARRGPVNVEVSAFVEDPTAREREQAEQERVAEVERLRAELEELRAERANKTTTTGGAA